ncbi:M24 family metallopeptidase [Rariglobus hedericola]|uniref:Aminopeptidase P family protein n=1 Tax=Rariglobus hedericola TaxID=2597822 RepID=A0A556QR05_9BACT|nr:Xaa-Pro peptidase family protein [Rariglobus hedericola]TSJ79063.1 aminopeptidase P family protein [Rariglobus hedericola]
MVSQTKHNFIVARTAPSPLLYADTARSADMLYFGRFSVPDPFIAFGVRGKKIAVLNALEFGRAQKSSGFDTVLPLEPWLEKARAKSPKAGAAEVIGLLAKHYKLSAFEVASDFPLALADKLRALGLKLTPVPALFPEREIKTAAEAAALREGNRCSATGIAAAEQFLRRSKIKAGQLMLDGKPLTSERLKTAIEIACLEAGALSIDTIAAGGDQACDPHERGHGPLRAHELIVVDVFPRVTSTGYHGDMTRTFLKGRASEKQQHLVAAVRTAQLAALDAVRAGVNGRHVHQQCLNTFERHGFETKRTPKGSVGFFHGTGHGLGLEVHEAPRMSSVDYILKKGSVVTVEPGLYYPGLGGCRIEDVVQVTDGKPKMLSSYHYDWEIR